MPDNTGAVVKLEAAQALVRAYCNQAIENRRFHLDADRASRELCQELEQLSEKAPPHRETFRERAEKEHPGLLVESATGGMNRCPFWLGYEERSPVFCEPNDIVCRYCWDREIPDEQASE